MSNINDPKNVVPDNEFAQIADELVEFYDFDSELEDEELTEFDDDELRIVTNYENYINMSQVDDDIRNTLNLSDYRPAQVIRVISKTPRTLPSGQIVLDYELEIQGVSGASSYEVRVSEQ